MAIIVTEKTKVLVQGITGEFGARHTKLSLDYGSAIVAGVTPGKGGQFFEHGSHRVPIFNPVRDAVAATRELGLKIPLVVRLEGNNVVAGKQTLAESGLKIDSADTMADAAQKIVKLVA